MTKPFIPNDYFAQKAKQQGWLARSAFKLEAINDKFHVLQPKQTVLDLGAAPGSWLQVASKIVGPDGRVVGVDLSPIKFKTPNVKTFKLDILDSTSLDMLAPFGPFDVILSDLAPKTTGIRERDQALSLELAEQTLALAEKFLKPTGSLVIKIFQGPDTKGFINQIKTRFKTTRIFKPIASRERSFETYVIGLFKID